MGSDRGEFLDWLATEGAEAPFDEQWDRFRKIDELRAPDEPPVVAWVPDEATMSESHLGRLMAERGESYSETHAWSTDNRNEFWTRVIDDLGIVFETPPSTVLDDSRGAENPRWLTGARMNIADSCFAGDPGEAAILHASEENPALRVVTRGDLHRMASRVTSGLRLMGLQPGEAVGLYMPMTVECVAAYLGIVQAGLRVVSIADSFPPPELSRRAHIGGARALIVVSDYVRAGKLVDLYAKAKEAEAPRCIVIPGNTRPALRRDDVFWGDFLGEANGTPRHTATPNEVTNVLFSSGTTGTPKAIPWTHLTPVKCAMD
ncbi:MAG: AMP-binding protein, partial [Planctomycetota bacterium]